ncbi:hypothetical protein DPMN_114732 [Dreissena polymorpha]|uniref:Uncharacterized protein n=1 Tax=Dreissena polymorpha TaxID=45954 RepID=A0A9D4QSB3_DREPO|nr:hypothetical protein DPMN_114732 [Dreissena polymorpha]
MVFRPQIPPPAEPSVTPDTDLASAPEIANALVVSHRGDLREILNRERHLRERGAVHRDRSRSNQRDHNAVHSEDEAGFDFGSTRIFTNSRVVPPLRADRPYPQTTDENTETPFIKSKSRSQRGKRCSFPECPDAPFRNARRHVRERHLPAHFGNNELLQLNLNDRRLADLLWIGTRIFGHEVSHDELVRFVNRQRTIPADAYVPSEDIEWLSMVCKQNGWAAPDKYNLHPVNSKSLLFHWRVLTVLLFNTLRKSVNTFNREGRRNVKSQMS